MIRRNSSWLTPAELDLAAMPDLTTAPADQAGSDDDSSRPVEAGGIVELEEGGTSPVSSSSQLQVAEEDQTDFLSDLEDEDDAPTDDRNAVHERGEKLMRSRNKSLKAEGIQESSPSAFKELFYHSENVGWMWAE